MVRAARGEAQQLLGQEDRRDDGDVGQVGAAGEGVVEDPGHARGVLVLEHRRNGGGHRAEVHGDVLGLHDHLPVGVEQGGRGVAALLDVGGVRGVDQHHAHLLARRAQGAGDDLQFDRVKHQRSRRRWIVPCASTSPDQPGGTSSVDCPSAQSAGPRRVIAGASSPR